MLVGIGVADCLDDISVTVENRQLARKQPASNHVTRRDRANVAATRTGACTARDIARQATVATV